MTYLTIFKHNDSYIAGSTSTLDEMHNLSGDLFELWSQACDLLLVNGDRPEFEHSQLQFRDDDFQADWNDDLDGYVLTFSDGKTAHTQCDIEQNKLDAGFGDTYLERYTEYDDDLSEEQHELVNNFVKQVNKIAANY